MSNKKIEKVIPICHKNVATAEEIIDGCGNVCRASFGFTEKERAKGYLSCSITDSGHGLALCLWKQRKDDKYDKVQHIVVYMDGIIMLRGASEIASKIATDKWREESK